MTELKDLLDEYKQRRVSLDIWRRYPDITEEEDAYTDSWACEHVSAEFASFASTRGWVAVVVCAEMAETPFADYHVWVRLTRGTESFDVDWTARQYHNLHDPDGHDEAVLALPWPLVFPSSDVHPVAGQFKKVSYLREAL